jgi:lycopene beta-cyclase
MYGMDAFDLILVGGGLQNGLIALAVRSRWPHARIAMVERAASVGGNHTWCFHAGDVSSDAAGWIAPLVSHRWNGYDVCFEKFERRLEEDYAAVTSDRFAGVVSAAVLSDVGSRLLLETNATRVGRSGVTLGDSREISGTLVIDARGPERLTTSATGYQKFVGLETQLKAPHGLERPVLMDARVDQSEGYRFLYVLPLSDHRLLIEDTYFNESPSLDAEVLRARVLEYADGRGFEVNTVLREETGVLPMPWAAGTEAKAGGFRAGYAGGWFHPGTGYSFPVAARLADFISRIPLRDLAELPERVAPLARAHGRQSAYCHLLNRLLFQYYPPQERRHVFERFYRLPQDTIRRFYALNLSVGDRVRLLAGSPPRGFSLRHAMARGGAA